MTKGEEKDDQRLPADRRQDQRKVVPEQENISVSVGQPGGTSYLFSLPRTTQRKKPPQEIIARLLAKHFVTCAVENISAKGLCICSMANLEIDNQVGIYLQLPAVVPGQEKGITLICKVIWHKPWKGTNSFGHLSGLTIINNSDAKAYKSFIDGLPLLEEACA